MNWYFVEYYGNSNVIKSEKSDSEFRKEFNRYKILAHTTSLQKLIRQIQRIEKTNRDLTKSQLGYIKHLYEKHPEYVI